MTLVPVSHPKRSFEIPQFQRFQTNVFHTPNFLLLSFSGSGTFVNPLALMDSENLRHVTSRMQVK